MENTLKKNKKKRIIAIVAIIILVILSFSIFFVAKASSIYYIQSKEVPEGNSGYPGYPSADFSQDYGMEYAGRHFSICSNANLTADCSVTFCMDPGYKVEDVGAQMNLINDFSGVSTVFYAGKTTPNTISSDMKNWYTMITDYYNKNQNNTVRAAAQALIWEVSTGGRTSFSSVVPNGYSGGYSYYARYVVSSSEMYDELFANAYKGIVNYVNKYFVTPEGTSTNASTAPVHELKYNETTKKYTVTINSTNPLNNYTCTSSDGIEISKNWNDSIVTVSTSSLLSSNTLVTCTRGAGGLADVLYSANYSNDAAPATYLNRQRFIVYGGSPKNTIYFYVKTSTAQFKVIKRDQNGNSLSGSTFKLTNASNTYTITGNDANATQVEPGTYTLSETTVPNGYSKMSDVTITIPATSTDSSSNPYLSGDVTIYKAVNTPLKVKWIKKDSETDAVLKEDIGFTVHNQSGTQLYFTAKDSSGCYGLSTSGTIGELVPNADGYTCIKYVSSSTKYIIKESTVPDGYQRMADQTITAPSNTDTNIEKIFTFKNTPLAINFYKEDSVTKQRINNAGFTIYKNGSVVKFDERKNGCYKENINGTVSQVFTDTSINNGVVCLSYVKSGATYKVVETKIPDGYLKMPDAEIVAKKNTETVNLTEKGLTNTPLEIRFYKEDSETGKRVNNAGFTIYKGTTKVKFDERDSRGCYKENSKGKVTEVFTDTSINNGEVCLSYVTNGSIYKVTETTTPNGYQTMPDKEIVARKNTETVNLTNEILKETPLYMYFSKEDSDKANIPIIGAEFEVYKYNKDTKKYDQVKFTNEENDSEDCYIENASGTTKLYSKNITIKSIEEDGTPVNKPVSGGVCLKYVSADTMYKVIETNPIDGYTFFRPNGEESGIKMKVNHQGAQTNYNLDETSRGDSKIKNYPTMLEFEKKASDDADGKDNTITTLIDGALFEIVNKDGKVMTFVDKGNGLYEYSATGTITRVHTTNRKFTVKYLPWGEYNVREVEESAPNGYYYNPDLSKFTITKYTNGQVEKMDQAKANIIDKPVEITFEKTDIYSYYSAEDKAKIDSEEKLLDTAKFVLKDNNGNVLKLKYVGKTEEDGNIYRYLPIDTNNTNEKINTYKGKLKITHLMNNTTYVIEEVESMEGFILPNDHPKKIYEIKRKEPNSKTDSSITQVIENVPTKIKIEKRDLKTGYLIDDDKVTFELYKKDESGKLTRIYVDERRLIHDAEGNVENSYTYSKLNKKTDVRITTEKGVIVIRYLPKGSYVLKETEAPKGYDLPTGEGAKTYFEVSGETTEIETEVVKNKPSKIIIRKYSEDGYLITGARFKIYKVTNYDPNLSAKNQEKELISLKTIRQGEYENKEVRDTQEITTCEDACEIIGEETNEAGIIKAGELIVQYLETENYYVIEEVQAPEGYQLPENPYNIVYLKESVEDVDAEVVIENEYTPVTFYKYDEYNKLLDGAEYKLQKLNSNKKYEDINVSKMEGKEGSVYAVDYNSNSSVVTTTNGSATIYMLTAGQYRVVETKAPFGYELPKASVNVATFFVTDEGKTKGDFIIANKKPTTKQMVLNKANSELVINIQTGQKVMKYIGIIVALVLGIGILMFIIHKMNKKA